MLARSIHLARWVFAIGSLQRVYKHIKTRLEPAEGIGTLSGVMLEIDLKTKKVINFKQILKDGLLGKENGRTF